MVIISQKAINDVATFYANTLLRYPNTWTQEMVDNNIEATIKGMESIVIETLQGQRTPILQQLTNGQTAELITQNKRWYFSVQIQNDNVIIENAWYRTNASNRAYRRGRANPNADLTQDNRQNQERIKLEGVERIDSVIWEVLNKFLTDNLLIA